MNQKQIKSEIAKLVRSHVGNRHIEVGEFYQIEGEKRSINLEELGDPTNTDLADRYPLRDKGTVIPADCLLDLYIAYMDWELDTNLLVRIRGGRVVQLYSLGTDSGDEMPLIPGETIQRSRSILGITEVDRDVIWVVTHTEYSDSHLVRIMAQDWYTTIRKDPANYRKKIYLEVQGREIKANDRIRIKIAHGPGQGRRVEAKVVRFDSDPTDLATPGFIQV